MTGSAVEGYLADLFADLVHVGDGAVADYIPELAKADPAWFGIALATTDGRVYAAGDADRAFTIQSISKPFVYGAALDIHGVDSVLARVGVEPTGNAFNAIAVDELTRRPFNPMVNAGAIVTTGLIPGEHIADRADRVVEILSSFAGRPLPVDELVYRSERSTGDRNRAMAYLMRSFEMLDDVDGTLDLYFRQCSTLVTCRDLALMSATLASSGLHPISKERILGEANVERVLSIMNSCGLYDFAGEWGYTVGLPAKSGVSGGVIAVLPGQLGIAVYSPPLDERGNSVRGVAACARISGDLELHTNRARPQSGSAIRRAYDATSVRSMRQRPPHAAGALDATGHRIVVFELQGELLFASTEPVHPAVLAVADRADFVVLDVRRVAIVNAPAIRILIGVARELARAGATLVLAHATEHDTRFAPMVDAASIRCFESTDAALEWCEDEVLGGDTTNETAARLTDQPLLRGMDGVELEALARAVEHRDLSPGEIAVEEGSPADSVFFVLSGAVSVELRRTDGTAQRVAAFGAGLSFGEAALLDERERSADVRVEQPTKVAVLSLEQLDALAATHPDLRPRLYANLAQMLADRLRVANAQLRALSH